MFFLYTVYHGLCVCLLPVYCISWSVCMLTPCILYIMVYVYAYFLYTYHGLCMLTSCIHIMIYVCLLFVYISWSVCMLTSCIHIMVYVYAYFLYTVYHGLCMLTFCIHTMVYVYAYFLYTYHGLCVCLLPVYISWSMYAYFLYTYHGLCVYLLPVYQYLTTCLKVVAHTQLSVYTTGPVTSWFSSRTSQKYWLWQAATSLWILKATFSQQTVRSDNTPSPYLHRITFTLKLYSHNITNKILHNV